MSLRSNVNDRWYQLQHFLQLVDQLLSVSLEIFFLAILALVQIVQPALRVRVIRLTSVRAGRTIRGQISETPYPLLGCKTSEFVPNYVT